VKQFSEVFSNKDFRKLFMANITSQLGGLVGLTAFMYYILDRFTSQPAYASVTELMYSVPTLAVFLFVGVAADRLDRQKIAYTCNWVAAFSSLCLLVAVAIGWMPLIFFILFLRSAVLKFFFPAEQGLMQGILKKDEYTIAAGLNQFVNSIFMLFGNALGIFVYWTLGIYGAILIDAGALLIGSLLIKLTPLSENIRMPNGEHRIQDLNLKIVWQDFKRGFTYILNNKLLLALIYGFIAFGVGNGGFSVMQVFILKYKLSPLNYEEMSIYLGIVFGSGILIGSLAASLLAQKVKLHKLIITGVLFVAIFTIAASFAATTAVFMVFYFFIALALPLINIAIGGWMPTIIAPEMMGRVQGWINPLMMLAQSITLGVITIGFPGVISIEAIFWLVGACFIVVGIYYSLVLPKLAKTSGETAKREAVVPAPEG